MDHLENLRKFLAKVCLTRGDSIAVEHPNNGTFYIDVGDLLDCANEIDRLRARVHDLEEHGRIAANARDHWLGLVSRADVAQFPFQPKLSD